MYKYAYPRPALTVDCVVFRVHDNTLEVVLIERGEEPFKGKWALPGGFVREDENLEDAAKRELLEETELPQKDHWVWLEENDPFEQLGAFGNVKRDPRGRVVSVAYIALINTDHPVAGGTDAADAAWVPVDEKRPLAFDHEDILSKARQRLQEKVRYDPKVGFQLLPRKFTLRQLRKVHETILGCELDPVNFRKKVAKLPYVKKCVGKAAKEKKADVTHRPAQFYRFDKRKYDKSDTDFLKTLLLPQAKKDML